MFRYKLFWVDFSTEHTRFLRFILVDHAPLELKSLMVFEIIIFHHIIKSIRILIYFIYIILLLLVENCALVDAKESFGWDDLRCDTRANFICEAS